MSMEINRKAPVLATAEIGIDAPAALVWEVLSDIREWPSWNRSVSKVSMLGEFEPGTEFHWKIDGVTIVSTLQEIEPHRRLLWTGRLPFIRATHLWLFEERDGRTQVKNEESFEGLLAHLFSGPFTRMLAVSLQKGLQSLKQECERRQQQCCDDGD
jgi:hypothetical protein